MNDTYISSVSAQVRDDVQDIATYKWTTDDGREAATLYIGRALTLHVSKASPAALRRIAELANELADWREQQIAEAGETNGSND